MMCTPSSKERLFTHLHVEWLGMSTVDKEGESLAPRGIFAEIAGLQQEDCGIYVSLVRKQQRTSRYWSPEGVTATLLFIQWCYTPAVWREWHFRSAQCRSEVSGKTRTSSVECGNAKEQVWWAAVCPSQHCLDQQPASPAARHRSLLPTSPPRQPESCFQPAGIQRQLPNPQPAGGEG